ncbi:MAG: gluconate 2-dehydrogenase subunit 3 family protein [Gemmatimonadales bacterium]|nr:gluconate 2-dehydrogenase subunit 3 family protein [Gemmatimonadales bacterium]
MTDISRREALQGLAAIPAGLALSPEMLERARAHVSDALGDQGTTPAARQAQPAAYVPKQFTPDEWRLVRLLVDYVIPRDATSGSATDAGVPEFMDFILGEYASNRTWMKDGLGWMNAECRRRFGKGFVSCTDGQRRELLDAIAFPRKAAPEVKAGVEFFNRFRNMTASGFYSSRIGVADLGYIGNRPVAKWEGTPPEVLKKLGL